MKIKVFKREDIEQIIKKLSKTLLDFKREKKNYNTGLNCKKKEKRIR